MVPKRSGDRVKTDRRDSATLARLHRAGELRAIYVPDDADETMRDLVRAREDAGVVGTQAKYRLKAFLLRQGRRYPGREGWTLPYRRWLTDLSFSTPAQHITLQEYRDTIDETERRIERVTEQLRQLAPAWRWAPLVAALQALRGVSLGSSPFNLRLHQVHTSSMRISNVAFGWRRKIRDASVRTSVHKQRHHIRANSK
jgi:transposase